MVLALIAAPFHISSVAYGQGTPDIPAPPPEPPKTEPPPSSPEPKAAEAPPPKAAPAPKPETTRSRPKASPRSEPSAATKAPAMGASTSKPARKRSSRSYDRLAVSPGGETGLYRVASAETVTPGLIRLAFGLDFFRVGTLFDQDDSHSQVGGVLSISGAPIEYVELWLNTRAQSNSNDLTSPELLQSQGDLTLGVKGLYPVADLATVGLDLSLKMLSGIGSAAIDIGASQFQVRGLLTTDLMKAKEKIPFRGHLNVGFLLDNSDNLIPENTTLTNAERFALGISDFNRVVLGVGVEVPVPYVTPYLEYSVEFPVSYLATPGIVVTSNALRPAQTMPDIVDDIARPAVQRVIPQRITPGLRITAIPKLTIDLAVEIGITPDIATGVLAVPPYSVVMFASYPLDPFGVEASDEVVGPPISVPVIVPEAVEPPPSTGQLSGVVTNKGRWEAHRGRGHQLRSLSARGHQQRGPV